MNVNNLFNAASQIDLEPIKTKLMHVESGEGWSFAKTNAVEKEYRRYLCLMKLFPNEATAPMVDVDTFWHYHILDTMKYAVDCQDFFGYFLHHFPYVGMRGANDDEFRIASGERMRTLYESTFGQLYPIGFAQAGERIAYCAGPDGKMHTGRGGSVSANTAYCAGPDTRKVDSLSRAGFAYCAGPDEAMARQRTASLAANTAYCAGPDSQSDIRAAATAYCAGPDTKAISYRTAGMSASIAYCAGPDSAHLALYAGQIAANTAYCAGPDSKQFDTTMTSQALAA